MNPLEQFPESNCVFKSPPDLEGSCQEIRAYQGQCTSGIFDGAMQCITAWRPSEHDMEMMRRGNPIYLTVMGGLPPHRLSTSFNEAKGE